MYISVFCCFMSRGPPIATRTDPRLPDTTLVRSLAALVLAAALELLLVRLDLHRRTLDRLGRVLVLHPQVEPFLLRQAVQDQAADGLALLQAGTAVGHLAQQLPAQARVDSAFAAAELVVEVLIDVLDTARFDLLGSLVLLDSFAGKNMLSS